MDTKLTYRFDHEKKLICETFSGEIRFKDFQNHTKAKLDDPGYSDSYSLLSDIRGSVFSFSDEEKKSLYDFMKEIGSGINMKRKCAILTNSPSEVVTSELFRMRMNRFSPMLFKAFTTEEAALKWLME